MLLALELEFSEGPEPGLVGETVCFVVVLEPIDPISVVVEAFVVGVEPAAPVVVAVIGGSHAGSRESVSAKWSVTPSSMMMPALEPKLSTLMKTSRDMLTKYGVMAVLI